MFRFRHKTLAIFSGCLWFSIGAFLLYVGLGLLTAAAQGTSSTPLPMLSALGNWLGGLQQGAMMLVAVALLIGFIKGRTVLAKSANRLVARIKTFEEPTPFHKIYTPSYYLLIAVMMSIGMGMRFFHVPDDIRGFIDVAVGAALLNASMLYFRHRFAT